MKTHYNTHQGIHRPQSRNHKCILCMEAFPRREKLNKHLRQVHEVSDEDIKIIVEKGPESEEAMKILERLKTTKEEAEVVEYLNFDDGVANSVDDGVYDDDDSGDDGELITPDEK